MTEFSGLGVKKPNRKKLREKETFPYRDLYQTYIIQ